jgi:hypothetical protein
VTFLDQGNGSANTPADGSWSINFNYANAGSLIATSIPITFLPTGEVDKDRSPGFEAANQILAPTISMLRATTGDANFDFWRLLNWLYVSNYWLILYSMGQVAPTTYPISNLDYFPDFTSHATFHGSTNNIFVNGTLFDIYSNYLRNTLFPIAIKVALNPIDLPDFIPVDENNRLHGIDDVTFVQSYSCVQRQLKTGLNFVVSVFVAGYAIINGSYGLVIWIVSRIKRRELEGASLTGGELTDRELLRKLSAT